MTTPIARLAAAVLALIAWLGLALQFETSLRQQGSIASTLWIMLLYFTILTNLAVALLFTGIAAGRPRDGAPRLVGWITLAILLVGIVYALLLRGTAELSGNAATADVLLHQVTPVLVPLYWLAFTPKGALTVRHPVLWAAYPLAYFAYALARAALDGRYPYPFINAARLGWAQVAVNAATIAAGFLAAGYVLVALDGGLARRNPETRR